MERSVQDHGHRDLQQWPPDAQRWEAGGVSVKDEYFFAVFDDHTEIGRFYAGLQLNETNWIFGLSNGDFGYEGISYNAAKRLKSQRLRALRGWVNGRAWPGTGPLPVGLPR
jgi:hypothetical protein